MQLENNYMGGLAAISETKLSDDSPKMKKWHSMSWSSRIASQEVHYTDQMALQRACDTLHSLPPLITREEIEDSLELVREAANGKAFLLQGGDCAESFADVKADLIDGKVSLLREQAAKLRAGLQMPVVQFGRIAGQYAKPRSSCLETLSCGAVVHAFRGENINGPGPDERTPDPQRLLQGYLYAAITLHCIRSEQALSLPNLGSTAAPTIPTPSNSHGTATSAMSQLYTAHEALHLPYEAALTHGSYNRSAAFVWIGERTLQLDGAHVEYIRGLRNPIGVKIGPSCEPGELVALLRRLCSNREESKRVVIIVRLGAKRVGKLLPGLVRAVQFAGLRPVWVCDPCHGNTVCLQGGTKTRFLSDIVVEACTAYEILQKAGWFLGGLHLEQTGEAVTECLDDGGLRLEGEALLKHNYRSLVDPRLSRQQAHYVVDCLLDFKKKLSESNSVRF